MANDYGWAIFAVGFLLGVILTLIFVWITYATRTFIFTNCVTSTPPCLGADYYNDPGEAIAHGYKANEILQIDMDIMYYKRVQKVRDCVPENNQTIHIEFPQYCTMNNADHSIEGTWKQTIYGSNIYEPVGFSGQTVTTNGNCVPMVGYSVTQGVPQLKWDPTPSL
jgi:hypothetical protein